MASGSISNLVKSSTKTASGVIATRKGDIVTIYLNLGTMTVAGGTWTTVTTLDEEYRPNNLVMGSACNFDDTSKVIAAQITTAGLVQVSNTTTISARPRGLFTYSV